MTKRFIIDDVGTLIDMSTRDTFDYVSEVVDLLNTLADENEQLKQDNKQLKAYNNWLVAVLEDSGATIETKKVMWNDSTI